MNRLCVALVLTLCGPALVHAQIPVTDAGAIHAQIANHAETLSKWKLQYEQMTGQLDQLQKQYQSVTGSRGYGSVFNDPAMRDYLPPQWQNIYDQVRAGGYAGLTGTAKGIYDSNRLFDSCAPVVAADQRTACEARAVKGAQDKAMALDAFYAARNRISQIDRLMNQINATSDPKAIAELQARIATEQAMIQNEQIKLQMMTMVAAAEDKVQQQRQRELQSRTWSARKGITAQPLTFTRP